MSRRIGNLCFLAALAAGPACSRPAEPEPEAKQSAASAAPAPSAGSAPVPRPRFGAVMVEVGRRFELAGRAAQAKRFQLAAFEAGELEEVFEEVLPRAELPREGPTESIRPLEEAFAAEYPKQLVQAARAKNLHAFTDAFARAADACNGCHQASGHGFIEIPGAMGQPVPSIAPVASPAEPAGSSDR